MAKTKKALKPKKVLPTEMLRIAFFKGKRKPKEFLRVDVLIVNGLVIVQCDDPSVNTIVRRFT